MGLIRRAIHLFFGPAANKLLDITNVCRCVFCCPREGGWQPCENKTDDGKRECNWCLGSIAGEYPHCHGMGNTMLRAGWKLGRAKLDLSRNDQQ